MTIEIAAVSHATVKTLLVKNLQRKMFIAIINRLILNEIVNKGNASRPTTNHTDLTHEISPYSHSIKRRTIASGVGIKRQLIPY
jgi:hypothetical protein